MNTCVLLHYNEKFTLYITKFFYGTFYLCKIIKSLNKIAKKKKMKLRKVRNFILRSDNFYDYNIF
jgi:hypothetical protein